VPHLSSNHIVARSGLRISFDDAPSNCASKSRDTERRRRPNGDLPNAGFPGDVGGVKRPYGTADGGGYGYRVVEVPEIEDGVGYNALPMRALNEHPYDRAFWELLGKARNWQDAAWLAPFHRSHCIRSTPVCDAPITPPSITTVAQRTALPAMAVAIMKARKAAAHAGSARGKGPARASQKG
jgi:hypothetical protein